MYFDNHRWILIRHLSEALVAGLLLASAAASQTSSGCTAHPLSRVVAEFHVRDVGVLQALLQLGRENAICFGIESAEKQAFQHKVDLDARNEPALDVIKRMLSGFDPPYLVSEQDGVAVIRLRRVLTQTWLDYNVPSFKSRRGPLQEVNHTLHMTLLRETRPGLKGIAGHYYAGNPATLVGPFDEKNRTLRQLLNELLINTPGGGIWVVHRSALKEGPAPMQPFWTVVDYIDPLEVTSGLIRGILTDGW